MRLFENLNKKLSIIIFFVVIAVVGGFKFFKQPVVKSIILNIIAPKPELSKCIIIEKQIPGMLVQEKNGDVLWASSGSKLFRSCDEGNSWEKTGRLPYSLDKENILRHIPIIKNLLGGSGISDMKILNSGTMLVFGAWESRWLWRSVDGGKTFSRLHRLRHAFLPQGITEKNGIVFYGEYVLDEEKDCVYIWKGVKDATKWSVIYSFPAGSIRHIHAVQYDKYGDKLWVATGDNDAECKIMYSEDDGKTFVILGQGTQEWRTVSLMFTQKYVYWGMDSPGIQNYIFRWDRNSGKTEKVAEIDGPAYFSTVLNDGTLVLATTVEQITVNIENKAHVWIKKNNIEEWQDIGGWPRHKWTKEHGMLRLADPNDSEYIYLTPFDVSGHYSIFKLMIKQK